MTRNKRGEVTTERGPDGGGEPGDVSSELAVSRGLRQTDAGRERVGSRRKGLTI